MLRIYDAGYDVVDWIVHHMSTRAAFVIMSVLLVLLFTFAIALPAIHAAERIAGGMAQASSSFADQSGSIN